MNTLDMWTGVLEGSFRTVLDGVLGVLPNLIIAIIVVLLGWVIGAALSKVIAQIVKNGVILFLNCPITVGIG